MLLLLLYNNNMHCMYSRGAVLAPCTLPASMIRRMNTKSNDVLYDFSSFELARYMHTKSKKEEKKNFAYIMIIHDIISLKGKKKIIPFTTHSHLSIIGGHTQVHRSIIGQVMFALFSASRWLELRACRGPIWQGEDLSPCFREEYLDKLIPLSAITISLLILITHWASRRKRKRNSALRIAQLNPEASNIRIHDEQTDSERRSTRRSTLSKILTMIMPLNGSRLADTIQGRSRSKRRSNGTQRYTEPTSAAIHQDRFGDPNSTAAAHIFRTENAVIFNEVHRVLRQSFDESTSSNRLSSDAIEKLKRSWELLGSLMALAVSVVSLILTKQRRTWIIWWAFLSLLSLFTLVRRNSLFKHKVSLFSLAFVISLWELRSILIDRNSARSNIILSAVYSSFCGFTLIPSLTFPMRARLPLQLRAIKETTQADPLLAEARTAIPTPCRPGSPRVSIGESSSALEQARANQAKEIQTLLPAPESRASLLSKAFFEFVTPAIWKHYKVQFTLEAVPDIPAGSHAASVVASYRSQNDTNVFNLGQKAGSENEASEDGIEEDTPLLFSDENGKQDVLSHSKKSLTIKLVRHFAPLVATQMVWATIQGFASLTAPLAIKLILSYIAERSHGKHSTPLHMAVLYAIFLLVGGLIETVSASQGLFIGRRLCIRARAILIFEIVNKSLRRRDTGGAAKQQEGKTNVKDNDAEQKDEEENKRTTDGEVTNLVAVDVFRVSEIGAYIHFIFPLSPVQIVLCVVFLLQLLGLSALVGIAAIVIAIPLQIAAAKYFTKKQAKMLKATDERLNLANEVLTCIKTVKFFAWEKPFEKRMGETREKELQALRERFIAGLLSYLLYLSLPTVVTMVTFTIHTLVLKRPLPAETAFTALALFNSLRNPLDALPDMLVSVLSAIVSLKRIDKFLSEEETPKYDQLLPNNDHSSLTSNPNSPLGFYKATFTYSEEDEKIADGTAFCLRNIDIRFPRGELTIIAGPVGSGKTTILLSLLGETRRLSGRTYMPCAIARTLVPIDPTSGLSETVAYCPQSPWLLGATVKENILFGQPFDERRYRSVIKACALEPDLEILEYNDETEVGEKGTALSGGQKARVALARAIYSPARYVLLDDVLSAVDNHTAKHLYRHCLKGTLMKGRTVIMVTHSVALCLPGSALAIALKDGKVLASGTGPEMQARGYFDEDGGKSGTQTPQRSMSQTQAKQVEEEEVEEGQTLTVEDLTEEARATQEADMKAKQEKKALHANIETYGKGSVGFKAYKLYVYNFATTMSGLIFFWIIYVFFFASSRITDVINANWLRRWASTYEESFNSFFRLDSSEERTRYFLTIYAFLGFTYVSCSIARDGVAVYGSLRASRLIYEKLLRAIVHAKPQWFDRTPLGRIMNRLSKDVETIDQDITMSLIFFIDVCLQSLAILLVACFSLPIFTILAVVIILLYWIVGALYIASSRDLKRLESVTRSPIFTLVGEVLTGAVVIRAYGDASRFTRHCLRLIDKTNRPFYFLWGENRWLSIRMDVLALITSFSVAIFMVLNKEIDAPLAGFTLSFSIQLVNAVLWVMRMYTQVEINANSLERVGEYLAIESERFGKGDKPSEAWPSRKGAIEVEDLSVRYSSELPLVLKNVSFRIEAGEKVGICGRTGSGKSSLALALFRFLEAETGRIVVDGKDISNVALEEIRKRLTIIPQEAQLFSGTVRFNMDPFGQFDDGILWDALKRCKLAKSRFSGTNTPNKGKANEEDEGTVPALNFASEELNDTNHVRSPSSESDDIDQPHDVITSLDMPVEQGGKNFSAGQRQLLALARGLLKLSNSNIVLLDESTASLDATSDAAVQRTIRQEMQDATLLVVAHRIRGIVSFDKVLVLDAGKMIEFDKPSKLLRTPGSAFRELCLRSGEFDLLMEMADEADRERAKNV